MTMKRTLFHSKIQPLTVTDANLHYEGSITLDLDLLEKAGIVPYERVQVLNINNGHRLETYTIPGERGSGICCLNGAAARLTQIGDKVIVIAYGLFDEEDIANHTPNVTLVDDQNKPK